MPYVGRDLQRGNYLKLDDIGSSFNGSTTTFNLTSGGNAFFPGSAFSILVSLGGVVQEPESAYQIDRSQIIFATAPTSSSDFFCIALGVALGVGVPGHNTVNNDQLAKPLSYGDYFRWDSANNRVGINTLLPSTALDVVGSATFSGNVSIGGTLTYEDVANIDAVGIITARAGIEDKTLTAGRVVYVGANSRLVDNANFTFDGNDVGIARSIFHLGDTDTNIGFFSTDALSVNTGGVERLRVTNNQVRVLDVPLTIGRSTVAGNSDLNFGDSADGDTGLIRYRHDDNFMSFSVAGTSEKVRIRSDGNIGINTTIPTKLVTIKADAPYVRLEAQDGSDKRLDFEVTNTGIATISATQSSQQLSFKTTSGEAIRIDSAGLVGIGTDDPQTALEIGKGHTDPVIRLNDPADRRMSIRGPSANNIASVGTETTHDLIFFTDGYSNERLRITSGGNIETQGLGTFEFNDGWSAEGRNVVVWPCDDASNWFSFVGTNLRFTDGGNFVKPSDNSNSNWGNIAGLVFEGVNQNSSSGNYPAIRFVVDQPGGNGLNYSLGSGSSGRTAAIDNNTAAFVSGNGNFNVNNKLGVGKNPPTSLLHVAGTQYSTLRLENTDNGADGPYIELYNNSSSPANGDYTGIISFKNRNSAAEEITYAQIRSRSTDITDASEDGILTFHTRHNGTFDERVRIESSGRVGVNIDAPETVFHVENDNAHGSTYYLNSDAAILVDNKNGSGKAVIKLEHDAALVYGSGSSSFIIADRENPRLQITSGGNVNIGGDYTQTTYKLKVTGSFAATTKSFVIDHPTKENHSLRYACLEGPENSVYVRGKTSNSVIELPDYWKGLVHEDSITVNVTPIGNHKVWVESINNNSVTIGSDGSEYFYTVFAERKDVEKLEVEVEK